MKATGVVRRIDDLGRIVIPKEIRNINHLKQIMDDYTSSQDNSIKVVMLKDFSKALGIILDKYKTSLLGLKKD